MKKAIQLNGFFIFSFSQHKAGSSPILPDRYSIPALMKFFSTITESIRLLFAGLWLVVRIVLEYFGIISDGNDRTTGIKDMREEYKNTNYR